MGEPWGDHLDAAIKRVSVEGSALAQQGGEPASEAANKRAGGLHPLQDYQEPVCRRSGAISSGLGDLTVLCGRRLHPDLVG